MPLTELGGLERARYVARMFSRITHSYDRMNTIMSAGRHHAWRSLAVDMAVGGMTGPALDLATGTGDFALGLVGREGVTKVVAADFGLEMLEAAGEKASRRGVADRIEFTVADAHALPFADDSFVRATIGFGLRNFIDVPRALSEVARVVAPGGRIVTLEIVRTGGGPFGRLFPLFFRHTTPWLGAVLARNREAYTYLPESVQGFLTVEELTALMENAGLVNVEVRKLAFGTVAIHAADAPG